MKKLVVVLAIAAVAVSCKKISAGGNKNALRLEEGVERYSDDHQGGGDAHGHEAAAHAEPAHEAHQTETSEKDSTAMGKPAEAPATAAPAPAAGH